MIKPTKLSQAIDLLEMAEQAHDTATESKDAKIKLKYLGLSGDHATEAMALITKHTEQLAEEAESV